MAEQDLSKLKIDKSKISYNRPRSRKVRIIAGAVVIVLAAALAFAFLVNPTIEVETASVSLVYPSQSFTILNASGYVVAQRKAAVSSKATGRLEWLGVEEGSKVKQGEIIARLEARDVEASRAQAAANLENVRSGLEQARAELEDAKLNFDRSKELIAKGFIAQMDYNTAEARYKRAQAGVSGAESAIRAAEAALNASDVAVEYTRIRAPFDAVVLTKDADPGDIVTPFGAAANAKAAVVTIADMSSLQIEADVSESNLEKVKMGQPCEIQMDALSDKRFRGVVHMIVPTADRTKASVLVKVRFLEKDPRVLPEMSAKVAFLERAVKPEEARPRTALPASALVKRDNGQSVFLVNEDRTSEVRVRAGEQLGDAVEVLEGVKAGDKVVVNPPKNLKSGSKISVEKR
jgi:RND family efflux transporter MFP subunit